MNHNADKSDNARVAAGAGRAFLGRLGALIEIVSIIVFARLYGAEAFGLYVLLWSYTKIGTAIADMAMTSALQRFVPYYEIHNPKAAPAVARFAVFFSSGIAALTAAGVFAAAPQIASLTSSSLSAKTHIAEIIRMYVWVLPLWTFVEAATASIRARRTFGPEIKIRIFYEQISRLLFAVAFAVLEYKVYGLFAAHLLSVAISAILALKLMTRLYGGEFWSAPRIDRATRHEILAFGISVSPANFVKKLFSELPIILLSFLLPGRVGTEAAAFYSVARKIASALQVVRITFEYVMAPLAAEKHSAAERTALTGMILFSTKMALGIALPLGGALLLMRHDILALVSPEFAAAAGAVAILIAGRVLEAASGPASAVIEATGHRLLPALNGLAGLGVLFALSFMLVPTYGLFGAAIAAALGLNVAAWAAALENILLYKRKPYAASGNGFILFGAFGAAVMVFLAHSVTLAAGHALWLGPLLMFASLFTQLRYGLNASEQDALGRVGRLARWPQNRSAQ